MSFKSEIQNLILDPLRNGATMKLDENRGNSVIRLGASDDSVVFGAD